MAVELGVPEGYDALLSDLKTQIQAARTRAALAVNRELVLLYGRIGDAIRERQHAEGWGAKVIARLASDLRRDFPDMKGFSPRNLRYMRSFAVAWPDLEIRQQLAAQLPWFHHCVLLDKVSDPVSREWYVRAAVQHGWSRGVLVHQIESKLIERSGRIGFGDDRRGTSCGEPSQDLDELQHVAGVGNVRSSYWNDAKAFRW